MKMTLLEYMNRHKDIIEFTITDDVYDIETYFFNEDSLDNWSRSMQLIASKLNVTEFNDCFVCVNLSETIEASLEDLKKADLFCRYNISSIMDDISNILAGYVSEKWLEKFASSLKKLPKKPF